MTALIFAALAVLAIYGAFDLQEQMRGCAGRRVVAWLLLSTVLGWKAADALLYGAPGFPASDWFLLLALVAFLIAGRQVDAAWHWFAERLRALRLN